jgi:hypothetical protein
MPVTASILYDLVVVSAVDIVGILKKSGIATVRDLQAWVSEIPKSRTTPSS